MRASKPVLHKHMTFGRIIIAAAVTTLTAFSLVLPVYAEEPLDVPGDADATATLKVSKVDAQDNAAVRGAHLAIYKDNELMVDWWTTDDDSAQKAFDRYFSKTKQLKQDVTYTLKELEAPDGYQRAADTTFTLRSKGVDQGSRTFTTTLEVSGADAEADGDDGIRLKEKRAANWETAYRDKYRTGNGNNQNGNDKSGSGNLSQTGDTTTLVPVIVLGIAGLAFIAFALHRRRHPKAAK